MVEIANRTRSRIPAVPIEAIYRKVFGVRAMDISLVFIGDTAMRRINTAYRGKHKTTNVLSFTLERRLGELLISLPQAKREAKRDKVSLKRKLEELIVHGMLHLKGYDHERSPREHTRMHMQEMRILDSIS